MLPPGLAPGGPPPGMPGPGGPPGGGHPSPDVVNAILARMKGGPGGPGGPPPDAEDKPNGHGLSPVEGVQSALQDVHDLMKMLTDPADVNVAAGCLKALTGLQHKLMTQQGPGGQ